MSAMRASGSNAAALYLRLPARADVQVMQDIAQQIALPFALATRGRVREQGLARPEALSEAIQQSQRVVLLFSASDVTVMRVAVPPLPLHRLRQALPALVEDRIIGDPAECVLAAGPADDGLRRVAAIDRIWLVHWVMRMRRLGARRLSALPLQLCLPLSADCTVAWLFDFPSDFQFVSQSDFPHAPPPSRELVIRTPAGEGAGLPLGVVGSEASSPVAVLDTALAMAAGRPLQLFVSKQTLPGFGEELAVRQTMPTDAALLHIELRTASWEDLIDGAAQSEIDLIAGIAEEDKPSFDWQRWRVPVVLSLAFLLLNVFALNGDWWRLHQEGKRLESEMLRAYRTAFPDDTANDQTVMADPLSRMKQRRLEKSRAAGEPSPGDFLWLSATLGETWPAIQQTAGLDARSVASVEYRDASLLLRFKSGNHPSIDAARKALAEHQLNLSAGDEPNSWRVQSAR